MKKILYILIVLICISCKNTTKNSENELVSEPILNEENSNEENIEITRVSEEDNSVEEVPEVIPKEKFKNDFDILLPASYRVWEGEGEIPSKMLTADWVDLYEKDGEYFLSKADYTIEKGFDECAVVPLEILNTKNNTLILLNQPDLELGKINSLEIEKSRVWPNEKITFQYNGNQYTLRAEGDVKSSYKFENEKGIIEDFHDVGNYKLYISTNNTTEMTLIDIPRFNDTFCRLLFVGDIDRDNKLDFIFSSPSNYESEYVILFLSSKAEEGKCVKKVSEIEIVFDC